MLLLSIKYITLSLTKFWLHGFKRRFFIQGITDDQEIDNTENGIDETDHVEPPVITATPKKSVEQSIDCKPSVDQMGVQTDQQPEINNNIPRDASTVGLLID